MFDIKDIINSYKDEIDNELMNIYNDGPNLLYNPINHVLTGGKRLRPILCMLTSNSFGGSKRDSLICSISIELLHIFSLVHDDIMDNDKIRHGRNTIHDKWNIPIGILAGDAILSLAFKHLNDLDNNIKKKFNSALIAICEGQALDIEYETKKNITLNEYLSMIDLKTSYMIGLCAELGATISGLDKEKVFKMKTFGSLIGRAFQIQDDLFEVTLSEEIMGKSLNSDLSLNKKTFLMIKANEKCSSELNHIIENIKIDKPEKNKYEYLNLLHKNNIINETEIYINKIFSDAENILDGLNLEDKKLYEFMNYIRERGC